MGWDGMDDDDDDAKNRSILLIPSVYEHWDDLGEKNEQTCNCRKSACFPGRMSRVQSPESRVLYCRRGCLLDKIEIWK